MDSSRTHELSLDLTPSPPPPARDPVCGMTVKADSPHRYTHQGVEHRFCCAGCQAKFAADPERYLSGAPARATVAPPADTGAAEWTCPMHPEIVRDRPGSCPICGMALEPRTVSATDGENPELTDMRRRLIVAPRPTAPLLLSMVGGTLPGAPIHYLVPPAVMGWVELLLAAPVVLWCGAPFF